MRAHLIRLDATTHWLALTTHHIVSDGWSADVMLAELASFYHAYAKSEAVSLAPLPIQYADYALWQRRWLDAGERERQLNFWRARLDASRDVLMLPGAAPRPAQRSARGARSSIRARMPRSSNRSRRSPMRSARRRSQCCSRHSTPCLRVPREKRKFRSACLPRIASAVRWPASSASS